VPGLVGARPAGPPVIRVHRDLEVPASAVWDALTDLSAWPAWGPSVRHASLDGGGSRLVAGATGRVATAVGVSLPFAVTQWEQGAAWAWKVAGVPATGHGVRGTGASRCRAWIDVPAWAPWYAPLCWVALGRLGRAAADRVA
jgi:hypothetical protein